MKLTSIIAIYGLFWVLSAFVVMPFGLRTPDSDSSTKVAGQADSAPVNFRPGTIVLRATVLAAVAFGVFYLNYEMGWITVRDLNFFGAPPSVSNR